MESSVLRGLVAGEVASLTAIRRDLHRHPELAYEERRTSGVVSRELSAIGVEHVTGLARGTGIVAHIPATTAEGKARKSVGLRADMDALPIMERTGAAYASVTPGVMHACGHDGHTANLIGVARVLMKMERRPNPVTLVFQPAEEGGAGARAMCEDGALDGSRVGPGVGVMYGLHGWPDLDLGCVGSRVGPMLAATDSFTIDVVGTQCHAAYPHLGCDAVLASAHLVTMLQSVVSRNVSPLQNAVVTVGMIQGGTAVNIIPERVRLRGTLRTLSAEVRGMAKRRVRDMAVQAAAAMECRAEVEWVDGYPVTSNEAGATARFFRVAEGALGRERVVEVAEPTMGGEDFAFYGRHVPACFFILGVRPAGGECASLHQPEFDFSDEALGTGVEMMCRLALEDGVVP